ncbi:hypothetical protein Agub_g6623 [Astrephomene gubernaculifera]|uniref:BAR domain-containing protein n=1 Tax=Astrephomene gubernaculifera TaxID=47775 RepID=A0AAD3DSS2_9CHLO|nr:hypothetical protein Agub_g6623 [Astrephomene gubernaculifera]
MGIWKRVSEKTKQTLGVKANTVDWKPTSNARNLAMIDEARKFSKQIKLLHRELREMEARISDNLGVLKAVLNSPLPRVYEMSDKGPVPVDKEAAIVGGGVSFETLTATAGDLKVKLQQEVLHPLDQWQAAYRMIKQRNLKCEDLRLELDAKRREAAAMAVTLERQKTKAQAADEKQAAAAEAANRAANGSGSPPGNKFEDAEFRLQKEEDKVARLLQRYRDVEGEVYSALLTLINDTQVLKQYAATALVVYQHAFAQAYTAFDGSPQLPQSSCAHPSGSTPVKSPSSLTHGRTSQGAASASPATPDPAANSSPPADSTPPASAPPPPAWYTEARQQATTMKYDSDDEN